MPKFSGHSFEGDATRIILSPNEHIAPAVRTCRGSIYRTRNDGRHKCRPYKDLKRKFLYYQVIKFELTILCKLHLSNSLLKRIPVLLHKLTLSISLLSETGTYNQKYIKQHLLNPFLNFRYADSSLLPQKGKAVLDFVVRINGFVSHSEAPPFVTAQPSFDRSYRIEVVADRHSLFGPPWRYAAEYITKAILVRALLRLLSIENSLPWCDGMWICNCFHWV